MAVTTFKQNRKKERKSTKLNTTKDDLGKNQSIPVDRKLQRSGPGKIRDKNQSK